jgi:hypothetical protein
MSSKEPDSLKWTKEPRAKVFTAELDKSAKFMAKEDYKHAMPHMLLAIHYIAQQTFIDEYQKQKAEATANEQSTTPA